MSAFRIRSTFQAAVKQSLQGASGEFRRPIAYRDASLMKMQLEGLRGFEIAFLRQSNVCRTAIASLARHFDQLH